MYIGVASPDLTGCVVVPHYTIDGIWCDLVEMQRRKNKSRLVSQSNLSLAKFEGLVLYSIDIRYFVCHLSYYLDFVSE
jgi:hypothetical protein